MALQVRATFPETSGIFEISEQINDARRYAVDFTRQRVKEAQKRGDLPQEDAKLRTVLRTRGRESAINLAHVRIAGLKIPFQFEVEGDSVDVQAVIDATRYAVQQLRARAPVRSTELSRTDKPGPGHYLRNTTVMLNGTPIDQRRLTVDNVSPDDELWVTIPNVSYASAIEAGFALGHYAHSPNQGRLRRGILYPLLHATRARFGGRVDVRFSYIALPGGKGGVAPVLELAPKGALGSLKSASPGSYKAAKRR